jgi:Holliday junction resolvasome RuvABC endonuclease subunit
MKTVGIDLSLTSTGVAIIEDGTVVDLRRIQSKGSETATLNQRRTRLAGLRHRIWEAAHGADLVAIEGPSFGQTRQGGQHDRAGLWWLLTDWLLDDTLDGFPIPVVEIPPSNVKKYATGKGNAAKDHVLAAVVRRYPQAEVSGNDEADSLVLAAMAHRHLGRPIDDLPKVNLTALDNVHWPEATA